MARAELRLRVLNALPFTHQRYLFEEIRKLSSRYLRSKRIPSSEVTEQELLSEVWKKLLGCVSVPSPNMSAPLDTSSWTIDQRVPEQDGRVAWLIEEIGGFEAIGHRYEDIQRQRFGRALPDHGRRITQMDDEIVDDMTDSRSEKAGELYEDDIRMAWQGLLILANQRFRPEDDVSKLLRLMDDIPDVFDSAFGAQWPVSKIVNLLNVRFSSPEWRADRVDNAKRRLTGWIRRLSEENGLDTTDMEALFARVGRNEKASKRRLAAGGRQTSATN
jgi:hypothetical protein